MDLFDYNPIKVVLVATIIIILGVFQLKAFVLQGSTVSKGQLISYKRGLRNCVKISLTTQGESAISTYCSFFNISNVPKLRSNVKVVYNQNLILGTNTVEIKEIK